MDQEKPTRRRRILLGGIVTVLAVGLIAAIGWWRLTSPPGTPPDYPDARPEVLDDASYATVRHVVLIDAPREEVQRWNNDPDRDLGDLIEDTEGVPTVTGTHHLIGDWDPESDRTGHRRRVEFSDGHFLAEEVLVDTPEMFGYMIWGFTDQRRFLVRQGVARFEFSEEGEQTRVIWTYSLAPTAGVFRPFVADFLTGPMGDMMSSTLEAMRDGVEAE